MNVNDITITSLETITLFDYATKDYICTLDELQSATIANSEEKREVTGKQGRKLTSLKKNKTVTVSGSNGLVSGGLLEIQTGGEFTHSSNATVQWTDYLTVATADSTPTATTTFKGVGTSGAEIDALYIKNEDGTLGDLLEQASAAASGKFAYAPATKTLTFHTDVTAGTEIVVFYKRQIAADVLQNMSDSYSKKCSMYIDAFCEDKCGNTYRVQFYVPKADFSGEFSLDMGDNQTVHSFEAEGCASGCGTSSTALWTYTIFGTDAADATSST